MKVVILAGGFGTRISEESIVKPKPMVEIGEQPILWHIMKIYSHYGFNDFIICAGYKQHVIKEYFFQYNLHRSDITFDFMNNDMIVHNNHSEPWKVTIVDTGGTTMTGGRVKRIKEYVGNEAFMLTYGDGVADININELVKFHERHENIVTMTAYNNCQRFGVMDVDEEGHVKEFREKTTGDGNLINIGYMVCQPEVFNYLNDDQTVFEKEPLERLSMEEKLGAYKHEGFWKCMDTLREKTELEEMWKNKKAPWKIWED